MGEIRTGANGGFSGKAGSVIGSKWRGISYIRGLARSINRKSTQAQVEQRQRFALMVAFLAPLKGLLEQSFGNQDTTRATPYNLALHYNLNHAITGSSPNLKIDFSKIVLSKGGVGMAAGVQIVSNSTGIVQVTWEPYSNPITLYGSDQVYVVLYNVNRSLHVLSLGEAKRSTGKVEIAVPPSFSGETVEAMLFFGDEHGTKFSRTEYVGSVLVF
ncbi:DUF6266 family protein [Arcticibacter sp. MXS-1]|uniref:DUF6266 family protein n=1 Tax=Arcticibacter sp. MXS-1 TaxID=3341726 RepID=UPI0035A94B61